MDHGFNITTVEEALDLLSQLDDDSWLIIFDNADNMNFELSQFIPNCDHGSTIFTTRNPSLSLLSPNSHIVLDVMSSSEAIDVLLSCVMQPGAIPSESDKKHAVEIVEELGYLPVAIVQAGCFIRLQDCMDTYLDRFRRSRRTLLQRPAKAQLDKHHHSIYIALNVTVPALSPRALQLSSLLGFFHYTGIPLPLFERVAQRSFKFQPFDLCDVPPQFHETVSLLQEMIAPDEEWEEEFRFTLEELQNYSLVTLVNVGTIKTIRYHTLVHAWAQDRLTTQEQAKFKAAAIRMLACGMSDDDEDLFEYLTVHIDSFSSNWDKLHVNDRAAFANVLRSDGDNNLALQTWTQIHGEVEAAHGEDRLRTSEAGLQLAECYRAIGNPKYALPLAKNAMEYRTSTLGDDDLRTLRAIACYARLLPYMEAKPLQTRVLDERKKALCQKHTEIAQALEDLATTLSKKFQSIPTACQLMNEAIIIRTTAQGESHRATLRAKERLATINARGGLDKAEASRLLGDVVSARKQGLGLGHRDTQRSVAQLAQSYEQQSQYGTAAELWIELLDVRRKDPDGEYKECTQAIERIAERLATEGNQAEAERLYQTLFELYRDSYGLESEPTILAMEHISQLLEAQGKSSEANLLRESILSAQIQVFGKSSIQASLTMEKLASFYEELRKFEQAVSFRMELVSLKSDCFGPDGPEATAAMIALDAALNSLETQSQYDDAVSSQRSLVTALTSSQKTVKDKAELVKVLANIAWEFRRHGLFQTASSTPQDARRLWDDLLVGVPTPPDLIVLAMESLSEIFFKNSRREGAEALLEDAVATRVELFGDTTDLTIAITEALIEMYQSLPAIGKIPSIPPDVKDRQSRIRKCMSTLWQTKRKLLGPAHPETIEALKGLANTCENHSHLNDAEKHLEEIIRIYQETAGETDERTLRGWEKLAQFHYAHELTEQGIVSSRKVLDIKRRQFGENHPETLIELEKVLQTCETHGMRDERVSILRESLDTRWSLAESRGDGESGVLDEMMLADMEKLVTWYAARKDYDEAIPLAQRILDARYRMLPHDHVDVLTSAVGLAAIYTVKADSAPNNPSGEATSISKEGYLALADSVLQHLIEVRRKEFGMFSEPAILAVGAYMHLLFQGLRLDDLEKFAEDLLSAVAKTYDNPTVNSRVVVSPAVLHSDSNPRPLILATEASASPTSTIPTSSESSYAPSTTSDSISNHNALSISPHSCSNLDPNTATTAQSLSVLFDPEKEKAVIILSMIIGYMSQMGAHPVVQRLWARIAEVSKKCLGSEHQFTLVAMRAVAITYMAKQMYAEAEPLLEEVLHALNKPSSPRYEEVLWVLETLAFTYRVRGSYQKAEDTLNMTSVIDADAFPGGSEYSLRTQASVARLRLDQGRWEEAEQILLDLLLKRDFLPPETHKDVMGDLILAYEKLGKTETAHALARDFLDLFFGPERATPCSTVNLALAYAASVRQEEAVQILEDFLERSRHSNSTSFADEQIARQALLGMYIATADFEKARKHCEKMIDSELSPPNFIRYALVDAFFKGLGIPDVKPQPASQQSYRQSNSEHLGSSSITSSYGHTTQIVPQDDDDEDDDLDFSSLTDLEGTATALEAKGKYELAQIIRIDLVKAKLRLAVWSTENFQFEKKHILVEDEEIYNSMEQLAKNYEKQGKHEDARQIWESTVYLATVGERGSGERSPYTIRAMDCLADSYEDLKLYEKAEAVREQLLEALESDPDPDDDRICEEMEQIAALCVHQERFKEAESWSKRVLKGRLQAREESLTHRIEWMNEISFTGGSSAALGDDLDAVANEYADLLKANVIKALNALEWLAFRRDERVEYAESEWMWRSIMDTRNEVLGKNDPITLETAKFLVENLECQGRVGEAEEIRISFDLGLKS
jgi:hypothetical protein